MQVKYRWTNPTILDNIREEVDEQRSPAKLFVTFIAHVQATGPPLSTSNIESDEQEKKNKTSTSINKLNFYEFTTNKYEKNKWPVHRHSNLIDIRSTIRSTSVIR